MTIAGYERQGYPIDPAMRQNIYDQVWEQKVSDAILQSEANKLGFRIGKKEKGDIYFGENAPQDFKNTGTNESGQYDPMLAKRNIEQYLKSKQTTPEQREQLLNYMDQLVMQRMREKFESLFTKSANMPRWMAEKQISDNSLLAKITVVKSLYNTDSVFRDTTVKITDQEIADYISKNKDSYKQQESRSINFVTFSAQPTSADTLLIRNEVANLKAEFDTTKEVTMFLQRNGSDYSEAFSPASKLSPNAKDSITRLPLNGVYGPYLEGTDYVMAKLLATKTLPDSAKAKHILIKTYDPQSKQQILDDSTAKKRIDSIQLAIKRGSVFDSLAAKFSDDNQGPDGGSAAKGGDLGWFSYGAMVPEFNTFCFEKPVGTTDVVKTIFGYHLIQVTGQKSPQLNYSVAYMKKSITASQNTIDSAVQAANNFAGEVKNIKSFDEVFQKHLKPKGYNKGIAVDIRRMAGNINGIQGFARQLVKDIYAAKLGEVLKPAEVNDNWVVAVVSEVNNEGTMPVAKVRPGVEAMLRHKKIGLQLKQKAGKISSLDAVTGLLGKPVQVIDSLRMNTGNPQADMPYDAKATGVIFNPSNKGKIYPELIVGEFGVYAIQVDNISATPTGENVTEWRKQQAGQSTYIPTQALRDKATVKDRRTSGTNNY
jgi:peptidyl-prolyl cis-trans isomerase D